MGDEKALLAAREIVKWLDGIEAIYLPHEYYSDSVGENVYWDYDGMVLFIESIIAHQYGEEPRGEAVPFAD